MVQTSHKQSTKARRPNESNRFVVQELKNQQNRKNHIKNLIEFFTPKERKFIKHG